MIAMIKEPTDIKINQTPLVSKKKATKPYQNRRVSIRSGYGPELLPILNKLGSYVYVADIESYEIIFMNKQMKDLFKKDLTGYTCWKSFHDNQNCPCEFCSNNKLISADGNPAAPYIWEFYNQKLDKWYELHDQAILWDDGRIVRLEIATDITKSKRIEKIQKECFNSLGGKIKSIIPESNNLDTAIQGILKHRDIDKNTNENQICSCLKRLSETSLSHEQQTLLKGIESYIAQILSPFPLKLSPCLFQFTLMETKIVNLIKKGNNTKEIATISNLSPRTIEKHREKIRAKLSIKNKKVNLYSYLMSIYSWE